MASHVQGVLSLDAYDLEGQTVLYRVDVNSPLNPVDKTLLDDSRLRTIKSTLELLSNSKVVILAHQSRPGKDDFSDMSQHSDRLSQIINRAITFIPDICSDSTISKIREMANGDILFLDNMSENDYLIDYLDDFKDKLSKKNLNYFLKGVINP